MCPSPPASDPPACLQAWTRGGSRSTVPTPPASDPPAFACRHGQGGDPEALCPPPLPLTHLLAIAGTDTGGIQNRLGVLFFMLLYLSLMSLSSLPIWRDEKLLFLRERDGVWR